VIEAAEFAEGLTRIGIAVRQPADAATIAVYHDVIGPYTTAEEWRAFVRWALVAARWRWLPKVPEIQDSLREFRGERPLMSEATDAYERVLKAGQYTPEGGTVWIYRAVRETCGDAAAEAFLAAGGNAAFATTWDEGKRRERFAAAYVVAVRAEPTAGLLPAGPTKALPSGEAPPTREDAAAVVEKLREMVGVKAPGPMPRVVELTPERKAELERQAETIKATADTTVERRA
jgi:hypothetical protein